MMEIAEVRHLDGIRGNFMVSEKVRILMPAVPAINETRSVTFVTFAF